LSVALAGIDRSNLRLGDPLVICGAGPIGLVSLLAANAAGAAPIVVTDIDESRLARAKGFVPRVRIVKVEMSQDAKMLGKRIVDELGCEAHLVLECTGVESSINAGIYVGLPYPSFHTCFMLTTLQASRFGGTVFVIGVGKDFQNIPFMHLSSREIDLRFQYRYHDTYPKAISIVKEGLVNLKPLVTHRFKLEDGVEAFKAASTPAAKAIKVQILDD
jgi:L-iditol 2-dehydrogenase